MEEEDFEGTLVLEKLAEIDRLEEFLAVIDSDDFAKMKRLMIRAKIEPEVIALVLQKAAAGFGEL